MSEPTAEPDDLRPLTQRSDELLQGRREVVIMHNGEAYVLRITGKGGLVLQKPRPPALENQFAAD